MKKRFWAQKLLKVTVIRYYRRVNKDREKLLEKLKENNVDLPDVALPFLLNSQYDSELELESKILEIKKTFENKANSDVIKSLKELVNAKITNIKLPLYGTSVSCGFTSPAEDHVENQLSLDEYLVSNPDATFFVRSSGDSMNGAGIFDGDLLIIDRSIEPKNNHIVLAIVDTEFTVKRLFKQNESIILKAENSQYSDINITKEQHFMIWGVVVHVIHHLK